MSVRTKKLRVLITTPKYPPYAGGASVYFGTLVKFLKEQVDLIILTTHHKEMPFVDSDRGLKIFRIIPNIQQPALLRRISSVLTSFVAILLLWLIYRPRLIHSHCATGIAFSAGLFSLVFRVPIIMDVRGVGDIWRSPHLKLGKVIGYISIGENIKKELLSLGIPEKKIVALPVINTPIVEEMAKNKTKNMAGPEVTAIFVGELTRAKGIDVLLDAFKVVTEQNETIYLICIGDGIEKRNCERFIKRNGIEKRVALLGELDHQQTLEQIAKSDFLILPSQSEGIPRVILEAFAFGKPVVTTNCGGIPEMVKDGKNGILVEYGDVEGLAKEILRLGIDENLRGKLGKSGKNSLNMLPSWREIANKVLDIYHDGEGK